ncbi:MAG TPA: energy transducer TonB [Acidiferrobacteraceae bacterium]|nr:energy transducer TonB [Acidiferrobacteraceae bacterium]
MHTADDIVVFTGTERLGLSMFGSLLAHLIIVLGITFTLPKLSNVMDKLPTLEVILVQSRSEKAPDEADFLAQANQEGGGEQDTPVIARSPLPVQELTERSPEIPQAKPRPKPATLPIPPRPELLVAKKPAEKVLPQQRAKDTDPRPPSTKANPGLDQQRLAQERARLSAQLSRSWEEYQKRPRRKFLSARTHEYRYASYMEAWRAKVERVGNFNYPAQAKRKGLTGSLVLDVALNPDGSINTIAVRRASGFKILDEAAIRIVRLAAPYAPFPDNIRKETDILHITRTWQFHHGNRLTSH